MARNRLPTEGDPITCTGVDRAAFLRDGFAVLRGVIRPQDLQPVRDAHEALLERQREVWARDRAEGEPAGGQWESSAQPRLVLSRLLEDGDLTLTPQTIAAVELWCVRAACCSRDPRPETLSTP